ALGLRQGPLDVRAGGLHAHQARDVLHRAGLLRIRLLGAGGVGAAFCPIAARRDFFEALVVADYDGARAHRAAEADPRFTGAQVDAASADSVAAVCREHEITHVMNAVDPRFVMPIFGGAFAAGADYLDMAM